MKDSSDVDVVVVVVPNVDVVDRSRSERDHFAESFRGVVLETKFLERLSVVISRKPYIFV